MSVDACAAPPARRHLPVVATRTPGRTESVRRLSRRVLARDASQYPSDPAWEAVRPRTYGDCQRDGWGTTQPCPWVACRAHLGYDVDLDNGSLVYAWSDRDPTEMPATCSLAVAARGPHTLEQVGALLNITRERVRQIERAALRAVRTLYDADDFEQPEEPPIRGLEPDHFVTAACTVRRQRPHVVVLATLARLRFGSTLRIARSTALPFWTVRAALKAARREGRVRARGRTWIAVDQATPDAAPPRAPDADPSAEDDARDDPRCEHGRSIYDVAHDCGGEAAG